MTKIRTAWSKLQWSLVQRGPVGTLRVALEVLKGRSGPARPPQHPFDHRYSVDTSGLIGGGELRTGHRNDLFNTAYYGMAPSRFHHVIEGWRADPSHPPVDACSFVDLGCGKGRAVMMASTYPFREVIGVELNPSLAAIAEANRATWTEARRAISPIRILCQDATEFVFPPGPCMLYLFNPFTTPVVEQLLREIERQFADRPGMLDVIYFNPQSEQLFHPRSGFRQLWSGTVPMSDEDIASDHVASPDDLCSLYRWTGLGSDS
jgi:SAM-dependent methyltransferase